MASGLPLGGIASLGGAINGIGQGPLKKDAFRCRASAERQRRVGC
jgi:hypothetical protein